MMMRCLVTLKICFLILICSLSVKSQVNESGRLFKPYKPTFEPQEYYIKNIIDSRADKATAGTIITSANSSNSGQPHILKGGLQQALTGFIAGSIKAKTHLRPVTMRIREFNLTEKMQSGGLVSGTLQLSISFETERNTEPVKLIEFKGGSRYTRSVKQLNGIEPIISKSIMNALQYFDTWINREAATNELLAKKVEINFDDIEQEQNNDTLYYAYGRRLSWSDFKGKPLPSSRFAAEIFPFFAFEESRSIENSVIKVNLKLKTYLVRSFSWVKDFARNSYTLNHEQRHFDLMKIASEQFRKEIISQKLRPDNYEGVLSVEYLNTLREMNRRQVQYDLETKHGSDEEAQKTWNLKIDKELRLLQALGAH